MKKTVVDFKRNERVATGAFFFNLSIFNLYVMTWFNRLWGFPSPLHPFPTVLPSSLSGGVRPTAIEVSPNVGTSLSFHCEIILVFHVWGSISVSAYGHIYLSQRFSFSHASVCYSNTTNDFAILKGQCTWNFFSKHRPL